LRTALHARLEVSTQSLAIVEQQNRELHAALDCASADADHLRHALDGARAAAAAERAAAEHAHAADCAERLFVRLFGCVAVSLRCASA
jgi:hypothetical protein